MGGSDSLSNVFRFFTVLFVQVFLLRQISLGWGGKEYLFVFLAPLFIGLLPLRMPRPLIVFFGFLLGLSIDFFYDTLGVHAAAATLTGYLRQFVLRFLEPRDGYKAKASPDGRDLALAWWMRYLGVLTIVYCAWFFSMQSFSPVFWRDIFLKSLLTIPVSWFLSLIFVALVRPRI